MSNVVDFRKARKKKAEPKPTPGAPKRRSAGEFALAVGLTGVAIFLAPTLWTGVPAPLLAVVNLLVAAVYVQQGPRLLAGLWIALSFAVLAVFSEASPVAYALGVALATFG
ncbi:hypothetical protein JOD31_001629 [Methylopila capsulata]|uniref:Uncharacterized protein n=1 Tax=Methylopila capsulata TaxID=61654 RepID=A0A9W6MQY1_9HYPH|nr:hypothetical protein [Methylopila capsulata]MBM7851404.1 hypothetical protein [Methylopila capsulata]GLK54461.1 hypothetical protein GCM10008170_04800 [Methylopila capsulata]